MKTFIKLHDSDNLPVVFNTANIGAIEKNPENNSAKTIIYFLTALEGKEDNFSGCYVQETVEKIYDMIYSE